MKKALAWMLTALLLLGCLPVALATEDEMVTTDEANSSQVSAGIQRGSELVVGSTTPMAGYFGLDMWGNNTSDMDVRSLLHGYATVSSTKDLGLTINATAVSGVETTDETDGSRTYTIHLAEGLTYNDGSPITAKDYVFSILLGGAPEIKALGGTPKGMTHIVGYDAYQGGQAKTLSGVRLVSEGAFSMQVAADALPYFYGMALLNVTPYPMKVIAPGCDIEDSETGVSISGEFNASMLQTTLLDTASGYLYNPKVTSGPYTLESFSNGEARFTVNERFLGNYEGVKPKIEKLVFKHVDNSTTISQLESGEIDILNKVGNGEAIAKGQIMAVQEGKAQAATYLRTGFAFLAFACEYGPTQSAAVRQAIALCLDKDKLMTDVTGGAARRVYGYYGLGQWMAIYTSESGGGGGSGTGGVTNMPQDLDKAKQLLIEDGWTLNEAGGAFTEGTDPVRYCQSPGGLEALEIKWAKTENSTVADAIEKALQAALPQIGIKLTVTTVPFNTMMRNYYREDERAYNMFYLATNFSYVFDPYYDFNTADAYQGTINTTGLKDEPLMALAKDMRETASNDMAGYAGKWLKFQQRFVEVMPMVPLYSNVYFDFYGNDVQGYDILSHMGWGYAIPYVTLRGD